MKRMMILGILLGSLGLGAGTALAVEWTSTTSSTHLGPKFGDHLKAKKTPTPGPKKEKKGS